MKKKIILLILSAILLAALFILLKPSKTHAPTSQQLAVKTFTYKITSGNIVGPDTISLKQDDKVKIVITSDTTDELHLHGYDKEMELEANKPAALSFDANLTGRFELELHKADKVIAQVEVQPN